MLSVRNITAVILNALSSLRPVKTIDGVKGLPVEIVKAASINDRATPLMDSLIENNTPRISDANKIKQLSFLKAMTS